MTIKCNNEEILCHKIVLAAFSPYFCAMFTSNLLETQTNTVQMHNVDMKILRDLVNYAYCGSVELNTQNVQSVLSLASLLQVNEILEACADYMETQLDVNNCISVYYFASMHSCTKLKMKAKEYLDKHFTEVVKTDEFVAIEEVEKVCDILNSDDLNIDKEEILLVVVFKWINQDWDKRAAYADRVAKYVRYSLIDGFSSIENLLTALVEDLAKRELFVKTVKKLYDDRRIFIDKKRAGILFSSAFDSPALRLQVLIFLRHGRG